MQITDLIKIGNTIRDKTITGSLTRNNTGEEFEKVLQNKLSELKTGNDISGNIDKKIIDKRLMDVCIQMESLFVSKMFKTMRNTVPENKLIHGGFAEEIFEDMLYDEYAMTLSKNENLGIASMLYDELSKG